MFVFKILFHLSLYLHSFSLLTTCHTSLLYSEIFMLFYLYKWKILTNVTICFEHYAFTFQLVNCVDVFD